ncbi:hydrogenase maturation protease [Albimonas pacifica]|uniref:Hydrogenase maturation protease n=1 Tax=Albimonas pacifica TaxID=1114924 RepID=A0A1I3LL65_9RHOB|nr:hydrogenase maturation protease [Albimonas pacifica]SFI85216.1 hydrogenase maturation protease [Albimonas pacifica]
MTGRPVRVIGLGAPLRGDDAVGREVARRLRAHAPPGVEIHDSDGETAALVELLEGARAAILVDACRSGAAPGALRRLDAAAGPLPAGLGAVSTHGLGPAEAIELARALGVLPPRCLVYAIEAARFDPGAPLTPAVALAAERAAERILEDLALPHV